MIAKAEYVAASAAIDSIARQIEAQTAERITEETTKQQAIKLGLKLAESYNDQYLNLVQDSLIDAATTAARHQLQVTGVGTIDAKELATDTLLAQLEKPYWGLTLQQRIILNQKRLQRNIARSAQLGVDKVADVYTKHVPFGAHTSIDKRVVLGTIVKMERDIAKRIGQETNHKLVRWSLSHAHKQQDVCDDLATNIDDSVVQYLEQNNLNEDPKGLYFAEDFPDPPHPNCQCNHGILVPGQSRVIRPIRRAIDKIVKILNRLRGK